MVVGKRDRPADGKRDRPTDEWAVGKRDRYWQMLRGRDQQLDWEG